MKAGTWSAPKPHFPSYLVAFSCVVECSQERGGAFAFSGGQSGAALHPCHRSPQRLFPEFCSHDSEACWEV